MPLIKPKSKAARNMDTEMDAGKPSLAIAYNTQRASKKGYAQGGMASDMKEHYQGIADAILAKKRMAEGGEATSDDSDPKFMSKEEQEQAMRDGKPFSDLYNPKPKKMAEGGEIEEIADDESGDEACSPEDSFMDSSEYAYEHGSYDDDQLSPQPKDSNEHGDMIDSDKHDMVSAIRKRLKAQRS